MGRASSRSLPAIRALVSKMAVRAGGGIIRSYRRISLDIASAERRGPPVAHDCAAGKAGPLWGTRESRNLARRFLRAVRGKRPIVGAPFGRLGGEVARAVGERPGPL